MTQRRERPVYPAQAPRRAAQRPSPKGGRRGQPPKRRRQGSGLRVILGLIAAAAVWFILSNYVFIVRNVDVVGNQSVSADAVLRASGIRLGTRLGAVDADAVRTNVDATGVLAFVKLERRYPVSVLLTVRERSRDAMILQAGKLVLLDSEGFVVSAGDSAPAESIPYITGLKPTACRLGAQLDVSPTRLEAFTTVLNALKARGGMAYTSELDLTTPTDIRIITRTGVTVLLGDVANMENKVAWMVGALQDLERRGETLGRLDVSSGTRADFLPMVIATPTPAPTQNTYLLNTPVPAATEVPANTPVPEDSEGAVIGEDAI